MKILKIGVVVVSAAALLSLAAACGGESAVQIPPETAVSPPPSAPVALDQVGYNILVPDLPETATFALQLEPEVQSVGGSWVTSTVELRPIPPIPILPAPTVAGLATATVLSDEELSQLSYPDHWSDELVRQVHEQFEGLYEGVNFSEEPRFDWLEYIYNWIVAGVPPDRGGTCGLLATRHGYVEHNGEVHWVTGTSNSCFNPLRIINYFYGFTIMDEHFPFEDIVWISSLGQDYKIIADVFWHNYRIGEDSPICKIFRRESVVATPILEIFRCDTSGYSGGTEYLKPLYDDEGNEMFYLPQNPSLKDTRIIISNRGDEASSVDLPENLVSDPQVRAVIGEDLRSVGYTGDFEAIFNESFDWYYVYLSDEVDPLIFEDLERVEIAIIY